MRILTLLIVLSFSCNSFAQKIIYSEPDKKDNSGIKFEIIGKIGSHILIYKFISKQHFIAVYNNEMQVVSQNELVSISDKIIDADFISFSDHFFMVYQFQKKKMVYCAYANIGSDGNFISNPVMLDSTEISFLASNKIYATSFSEDKKNILVYKRNIKNKILDLNAVLYDDHFNKKFSLTQKLSSNEQKEFYSDIVVDNSGNFAFAKTYGKRINNYADKLEFYCHWQGIDTLKTILIDLQNRTINEPLIKIDNLNRKFILNSFYNTENNNNTEGIFSALIEMNSMEVKNTAFNAFYVNNSTYSGSSASKYDNLIPKKIILKKSGGFMLIAEDFFSETLYDDNRWNRYDPYNPYYSSSDYYLYNPYYNNYRPYYNNSYDRSRIRYFYNDIVIADIDSSLHMNWNNSIHKNQNEPDNDNHLSFSTINTAAALHFLFIEKTDQKALITVNSLSSNGDIKKIPLIRNDEKNYEFMPRLGKQIGARLVIMPFLYFNKLGFALIEMQ